MTCEHYWREGVLRIERGEPDPHRDRCVACRREHQIRAQLIDALPLVGTGIAGDPNWQARVWAAIARGQPAQPRGWWSLETLLSSMAVLVIVGLVALRTGPRAASPTFEVIPGEIAMRSTTASVGDRWRISAMPGDEVRIYRDEQLVHWCVVERLGDGCSVGDHGLTAEVVLSAPGRYTALVIAWRAARAGSAGGATPAPSHGLNADVAELLAAYIDYQSRALPVR